MILTLAIEYKGLQFFKVYRNDDPWVDLDLFTGRSMLVYYAFKWGNVKTNIS